MKKINSEYLREVLSVNTCSNREEQMVAFLTHQLSVWASNAVVEHTKDGNILVTKKQTDFTGYLPCVVAHMDTVHDIYPGFKVREVDGKLFAVQNYGKKNVSKAGIGGDDKVGVFIALEMLKTFDNIKVAFFTNEEIGCIGSNAVDLDWFNDTAFVLQGDRRGNNEIIYSDMNGVVASDEFINDTKPIATKHGYVFSDQGSYTDATTMSSNGLCVSAYNIACGYYSAHTIDEYVVISDVEKSLNLFVDIIQHLTVDSNKQYLHENKQDYYTNGYYDDWYGGYYNDNFSSSVDTGTSVVKLPLKQAERDFLKDTYGDCVNHCSDEELINWYSDDIELMRIDNGEDVIESVNTEDVDGFKIEGGFFIYGNHKVHLPSEIKCCVCSGGKAIKYLEEEPKSQADYQLEYVCQSCGEILVDEYTLMDYLDEL